MLGSRPRDKKSVLSDVANQLFRDMNSLAKNKLAKSTYIGIVLEDKVTHARNYILGSYSDKENWERALRTAAVIDVLNKGSARSKEDSLFEFLVEWCNLEGTKITIDDLYKSAYMKEFEEVSGIHKGCYATFIKDKSYQELDYNTSVDFMNCMLGLKDPFALD